MPGAPEIWIDQSGLSRGKTCIVLIDYEMKTIEIGEEKSTKSTKKIQQKGFI